MFSSPSWSIFAALVQSRRRSLTVFLTTHTHTHTYIHMHDTSTLVSWLVGMMDLFDNSDFSPLVYSLTPISHRVYSLTDL